MSEEKYELTTDKVNQTELSKKQSPRIGNITVNYSGYDKPIRVIPMVQENGEILLLTNIRGAEASRVIIQDLTGRTIKTLLKAGYEKAEVTTDGDNIYIFTANSRNPMFYKFDAKTFEQKFSRALGESRIQQVCCDRNNIYTFDMDNAEVQTRDKNGNLLEDIDIRREYGHSNHKMYVASDGLHFASQADLHIDKAYKSQLVQMFGEEFMKLNYMQDGFAFDEETQTMYIGSRNLVYVANPEGIKGVMYFQDKSIMGLDVDPVTKSLMVSASNWPESDKSISFDKGGSVEIIPTDMVHQRIQDDMAFLKSRNANKRMKDVGHRIVDLSGGDFTVMGYLIQKAQEMGEDILSLIDSLTEKKVQPDKIISTIEDLEQPKLVTDDKSPLQQREDELTFLEMQERKISETERLIEQREGQNIQE